MHEPAAKADALSLRMLDAKRVKPQEVCAQEYKYSPADGLRLVWELGIATPGTVARGDTVTLTAQYALLGTRGGAQVIERHTLFQGERQIAKLGEATVTRSDGAWASGAELHVPSDLPSGVYTVRSEILIGVVRGEGRAQFTVQ